jgi:hypothetical protein
MPRDRAGNPPRGRACFGVPIAFNNGDEGIDVEDPDTMLRKNKANRNADLGIEAVKAFSTVAATGPSATGTRCSA